MAGKLGQVGGRMIDAGARQMADQFFAAFQAEVAPAAAVAADAAPAPDQSAGAGDGTAPATNTAALPAPPAAAPAATHPPAPRGEGQRVLWFVMGALSTGFGVWLGRALFS